MPDTSDTNNTNSSNTAPVEDDAPSLSKKDKILNFFEDNSKLIIIGSIAFGVICMAIMLLYFGVYYKSTIEEFADDFCECAGEAKSEFYNYSNDGFGYRSDLSSCFAEEFKAYSEPYSKVEKQEMLIEFKEHVVKKCPTKLANIFEYK